MGDQQSSSVKSGKEMSEKIAVVSTYKPMPNPGDSFLELAKRALFKFLGVSLQVPSNTYQVSDPSPDQVDDPSSTTAVDQTSAGVVIVARSALGTGSGPKIN